MANVGGFEGQAGLPVLIKSATQFDPTSHYAQNASIATIGTQPPSFGTSSMSLQGHLADVQTGLLSGPSTSQESQIHNIVSTNELNGKTSSETLESKISEPVPEEIPSDDVPVVDIVISNVVSSFSTKCHLNLKKIAVEGFNVIYKREHGMVSMKLRSPYTTASIWSSGKITVTGATSEFEAKIACRRIARIIQKLGFRVRFCDFRVVNVLGTCGFPWGIRITQFSQDNSANASYEPELHPGVTYRIKEPKATMKVFSTGSVTITAPRVENVGLAIEHLYPIVLNYKMPKAKVSMNDNRHSQLYQNEAKRRKMGVYKRRRVQMDESDEKECTSSSDDDYNSEESKD